MNAYHVLGAVFAGWALIVSALGITRHRFPEGGLEKIVAGLSVLLMAATIGAAVLTSEKHGGEREKGSAVEDADHR